MEKETYENMVLNTDDTVRSIYAAYGSDTGVLFGVKDRLVVKEIIDFAIRRIRRKMEENQNEYWEDIVQSFGMKPNLYDSLPTIKSTYKVIRY